MKVERDGDNYRVVLTPQEAHVLVWGGPQDVIDGLHQMLFHALVNVEDNEFTNAEYKELFDDLPGVYRQLRRPIAEFRAELTAES